MRFPSAAALSSLVALGALTLAPAVRADVAPPNSSQCATKSAGDACTTDDGKSGTCVKSTCSKLDYSDGTPPFPRSYDCLLCNASTAPSDATPSTSTPPQSTTSQSGGSSCVFGASSTLGAWAIAACVPLVLFLRGRKRRAGGR